MFDKDRAYLEKCIEINENITADGDFMKQVYNSKCLALTVGNRSIKAFVFSIFCIFTTYA